MTNEDLTEWKNVAHKLTLAETHPLDASRLEVVAGGLNELVDEVRRLRSLVREACSCLEQHDGERARKVLIMVDWPSSGKL